MTVLMDMLSGAIGGIIGGVVTIATAIGIPFFNKIIFKLFETKVDERANKAISDHNAKNDTKIYTSKALFELEQQAINNLLANISIMMVTLIDIGASFKAEMLKNNSIINKDKYFNDLSIIIKSIKEYKRLSIIYTPYLPEKIEALFKVIIPLYADINTNFHHFIKDENVKKFNGYFQGKIADMEHINRELNRAIREYYNSVKIV